ncbi:metabolite traffic protein EboE [Niabella sp. CC-SYL272]|uniref:metabolite traffic protein EboE n=1 Tax=Niabella agricola TaxID=2891571 RepID=UPI001F30875B|nr:metabolite traffic protein EboE [Niabella agricola]MCF3108776.1 metabolite traffic protein EboE [Niabella agricola]
MITNYGHLTYCSNIHSGESWAAHFDQLRKYLPEIKKKCSPRSAMGIGLRLSAIAARVLSKKNELLLFQNWLKEQNAYVFTINGFPYGGFHKTVVKDQVHTPDWTTAKRVVYTKQLADILAVLLPDKMEGSISTSPLSYRHWYKNEAATNRAIQTSTYNLVAVVEHLITLHQQSGKIIFIAIEPEPDGILTDTATFIHWYKNALLKTGAKRLSQKLDIPLSKAATLLKKHVRLCYDICHAAVNYEAHADQIIQLQRSGIKIGKIQISAALKAGFTKNKKQNDTLLEAINQFLEPTYLHQVISRNDQQELSVYPDLPEALKSVEAAPAKEWRIHYHVPIFTKRIPPLSTTQEDIVTVLNIHKQTPLTQHLEIETYTWEVLPNSLKRDIAGSITREMKWVLKQLNK